MEHAGVVVVVVVEAAVLDGKMGFDEGVGTALVFFSANVDCCKFDRDAEVVVGIAVSKAAVVLIRGVDIILVDSESGSALSVSTSGGIMLLSITVLDGAFVVKANLSTRHRVLHVTAAEYKVMLSVDGGVKRF